MMNWYYILTAAWNRTLQRDLIYKVVENRKWQNE
jgi:hypothetical protein